MSDSNVQAHQERGDPMSAIFSDIVTHAEELSRTRCPYRDRHDLCTALFLCRCQIPVADSDELSCGHDGTVDYRTAWESTPRTVEWTGKKIVRTRRDARERRRGRTREDRDR